jgi:hypothetical protein
MGKYAELMQHAMSNFLTSELYDYSVEFSGKYLYAGTRMPLTKTCYSCTAEIEIIRPYESWSDVAFRHHVTAKFCEAGKRLWDRMIQDKMMDGLRLGSISTWASRKNERKRQIFKVQNNIKREDWQAPRKHYHDNLHNHLEVWDSIFANTIGCLDTQNQLDPTGYIQWQDLKSYISDTDKSESSLMPKESLHYDYLLYNEDLFDIVKLQSRFFTMIRDNPYSRLRVNPDYLVVALRDREPEWGDEYYSKKPDNITKKGAHYLKSTTSNNGITIEGLCDKQRDREAEGQAPESQGWMMIKKFKEWVIKEAMKGFLKLTSIKENIYTPFTEPKFYYYMAHRENGIYLFGDNAMIIKKGKIIATYDMSTSDVYQAFMRRSDLGENFSWFVRLNRDLDCGPTGDMFTTVWTIEGLLEEYQSWLEGNFSTSVDWPRIPDLCEEAETFLGWHFRPDFYQWVTLGNRATVDNAGRRLPFRFAKANIHLGGKETITWPEQTTVNIVEFAESIVPMGIISFDFIHMQDWIQKKNLQSTPRNYVHGDNYGTTQLVDSSVLEGVKTKSELMERVCSFMDNFDKAELLILSKPMILTDLNFSEYVEKAALSLGLK